MCDVCDVCVCVPLCVPQNALDESTLYAALVWGAPKAITSQHRVQLRRVVSAVLRAGAAVPSQTSIVLVQFSGL